MKAAAAALHRAIVPKRRQRHYSYDESLDEPGQLIADESVEIEGETPTEERESVETAEAEEPGAPVFEE